MYYSYVEIEYVATSFSPARTDLALKLLRYQYRWKVELYLLVWYLEVFTFEPFLESY
jgi:hypothetical protein